MKLLTKHYKLKDFSPDKAKEFAERFNIKEEDVELVSKGVIPDAEMKVEGDERAVIKYVSTLSVDRDGDIVLPKGVILDDFRKNPVVLYGHNYGGTVLGGQGQLPIGKDMWIKPDKKGIIAKQTYARHQLADDIYNMHKDGFGLASSIGFIPLEWVDSNNTKEWKDATTKIKSDYGVTDKHFKGASRIYTKTYLLEHSDVPVPSNPDALTLAVKSGDFTFANKELMNVVIPEEKELPAVDYEPRIKDLEEVIKSLNEKIDSFTEKLINIENQTPKPKEFDVKGYFDKKAKQLSDSIDVRLGKV